MLVFLQTFFVFTLREVFQTLHDYNLAQGLAIHTRFDDFDLISRLQVYQNHQLQLVFRFLCTVVQKLHGYYIHLIGQVQYLCETVVYLGNITITFSPVLHVNVSRVSCSGCWKGILPQNNNEKKQITTTTTKNKQSLTL